MKIYKAKKKKAPRTYPYTPARQRCNKLWRRRNPEAMREIRAAHYERRREWYLWKARLGTLLARVVTAEEARGRFES